MKQFLAALCTLVALGPALAAAGSPTEASLHELLAVMESHQRIDGMWDPLVAMNRANADKMLAGESMTPERRRIIDDMPARMLHGMRDELRSEVFEPLMVDVYGRTFTQQEVDGVLAVYTSDVGRAMIAKLPLAMQYAMQAVQARLGPVREKPQQVLHETAKQLTAAKAAP